ncbi:MAG: hypothetical protein CM15mP122_5370 [Bacteroidota bacterium]|nr:MAG: hypothetical protein CM15mP122_5370 [Bacteroidota bacterium]
MDLGVGGGAASTTIASATIGYQWQSSIEEPHCDIVGATTSNIAQHQILLFRPDSEGFLLFIMIQMVMGSSMNPFMWEFNIKYCFC